MVNWCSTDTGYKSKKYSLLTYNEFMLFHPKGQNPKKPKSEPQNFFTTTKTLSILKPDASTNIRINTGSFPIITKLRLLVFTHLSFTMSDGFFILTLHKF